MYASAHIASIYELEDGGDAILLNLHTKQHVFLNSTACQVWRQLIQGVSLEEACQLTAGACGVSPDVLKKYMGPIISQWQDLGIISANRPSLPVIKGETVRFLIGQSYQEQRNRSRAITSPSRVTWRYTPLSLVGMVAALVLLRLPFRWSVAALRGIRKIFPRRASLVFTRQLVATTRFVARGWLGRAACLEISLGTFLAGALLGKPPVWCLGAHLSPWDDHAWIESEEEPVLETIMKGVPYGAYLRI